MKLHNPVLFGGTGKFGREFLRHNPGYSHPGSGEVDISHAGRVLEYIHDVAPSHVVHAAAVVGRREAGRDRERAYRVNVLGTRNVASACRNTSARLIYISSAAVFSGENGPYKETDIPHPQYYYGWTKLLGEQSVAMTRDHVIVRTDFFVPGSVKHGRVFVDHFCSKIPVAALARTVGVIAVSGFTGVINVGRESPVCASHPMPRSFSMSFAGVWKSESGVATGPHRPSRAICQNIEA